MIMDTDKLTVDDLKTAYKVVTKIMKENNLMKDNSFNRVRNWISNSLCDNLVWNKWHLMNENISF